MDHRKKEIIKIINGLSGSRSPYDVFCDWVKCMALSIQNNCSFYGTSVWQEREEEHIKTIHPYGTDKKKFSEMFALLALILEDDMTDALGQIYMESGCGNKNTGQFFTPFHVSEACARLALMEDISDRKRITLNEPSCGGGGMIIATAKALKDKGINYQRTLDVVAQDLDWKAVYMCYVQLSLLGIRGIVVQGNTLYEPDWQTRPPKCIFYTPKKMGMLP